MKEIELTQNQVALVRDDWYDYLSQWKWFYFKSRKTGYAARCEGTRGHRKFISMHRVIMNTPNGMEVDHIDHNGLHNWPENMRNCTHSQNQANSPKLNGTISKFKGLMKKRQKWQAKIKINGTTKYLGQFDNQEDAARAYNDAAIKYFGEYANLNDI